MEPTLAVSGCGRLKRLPVDGFFYKHVRGVAPDDWTVGDGFERIETAAGCCFCCCAKIMRTGPFCDRAAARRGRCHPNRYWNSVYLKIY